MASLYHHPIYSLRYSALPVTLMWTGVLAALAYAELRGLAARWLLVLITAPAALFAFLHCIHALRRLSWAIKTYRRHLPRLIVRMVGLFPKLARSRHETTKAVVHVALAVAALALFFRFGVYSGLSLAALLLGIVSTVLLRALLPPGGVYLASSSPERVEFFGKLSRRTIPGVAALLEVSNRLNPIEGSGRFLVDAVGVINDYRTRNPDDWTAVVRELIEMTGLVIVDGRDETPGVQLEVGRILRNRLEFKTAFLSIDGNMPAILSRLEARSSHPSGTFQLMTPEYALQAVPIIVERAREFWIPVRMDA